MERGKPEPTGAARIRLLVAAVAPLAVGCPLACTAAERATVPVSELPSLQPSRITDARLGLPGIDVRVRPMILERRPYVLEP